MNKAKNKKASYILGVVTLVGIFGAVFYASNSKTSVPQPAPQINSNEWKTYRSEKYKVEFNYPGNSNFEISQDEQAFLSKKGSIINIQFSVQYILDWNTRTTCPGPGNLKIIKTLNVDNREVILCFSDEKISNLADFAVYRIIIPYNKGQMAANKGNYFYAEAMLENNTLEEQKENAALFEKIITSVRFQDK